MLECHGYHRPHKNVEKVKTKLCMKMHDLPNQTMECQGQVDISRAKNKQVTEVSPPVSLHNPLYCKV